MKTFFSNPALFLLSSMSMTSGLYKPLGITTGGFESKLFPSIWQNTKESVHTLSSRRRKEMDEYDFKPFNSTIATDMPATTTKASKNNSNMKRPPTIQPKTKNQIKFLDLMRDDTADIIIAIGPAGTGKTMLACYAAVEALRNGIVNKIVVTRPVVSVDEEIGFLPGGLESKMDPWTRPIFDVLRETYSAKDIERMTEECIIEIVPLGFMRGRTFKKSWIIADEMQNSSPTQMFMLATRIGEDSKMIITGDLNQSDYNPKSNGLLEIYNKVCYSERVLGSRGTGCVRYIELDKEDVQRSRAAKMVLDIYDMKPSEAKKIESVASSYSQVTQYDESNPCSNELEYFDINYEIDNNISANLSEEKNVELVDVRDSDAALMPLSHIKQLRNFKEK